MAPATSSSSRTRAIALVLTLLLAVALQPLAALPAAGEPVPTLPDEPVTAAEVAAGWLALELVDGERLEGEFGPDAGLTADAVFALAAAGVAEQQLLAAIDWLSTQAPGYTQGVPFVEDDAVFAGATAKLILALLVDDRDVRDIGGIDLITQLEDREQDDGRFTDDFVTDDGPQDFSSTLTQSLAVLALQRAEDAAPSAAAVGFLLDQQCEDGGFRAAPDADGCTSSVDTTGFAVQALVALDDDEATAAAEQAAAWLVEVQDQGGAYASADGLNANSTALAALAIELAPEVAGGAAAREAALDALLALRTGCEGAFPGAIPFSAEDTGDVPRATTQVIPALVGTGLATASASGARAEVPALLPFTDVTPGSTHAPAICELSARDAIRGFDARTFGPQRSLTRAQAASILAELLDLAPVEGQPFDDVPAGSLHAGAIAALDAEGIVGGQGDGNFRPSATLRRDQAASLLARALELDPAPARNFDDVDDDSVHAGSIAALAERGIVTGTTPSTYAPALELRRDQFASLLQRAFFAQEDGGS